MNNPNLLIYKYEQLGNKAVSQLQNENNKHMQNNPAGNSKHFCKSDKLLNGKRASTIPVTHHG